MTLIFLAFVSNTAAGQDKPNVVVIWGDDADISNISAYHRGMLGGSKPNIDRIAAEGALFTDNLRQSYKIGHQRAITVRWCPVFFKSTKSTGA